MWGVIMESGVEGVFSTAAERSPSFAAGGNGFSRTILFNSDYPSATEFRSASFSVVGYMSY
jgi:hypothetical protein